MNKALFNPDLKKWLPLPQQDSWPELAHRFDTKSVWAVRAAIASGRRLLLRGESGIGKSQIARAVAEELQGPFLDHVVDERRKRLLVRHGQPWAVRPFSHRRGVSCGTVPFVLRWIPPGRFLMGLPEGERGRWDAEGPQHEVTISRGFWMGETLVTQNQWATAGTPRACACPTGQEPAVFSAEPNVSERRSRG